VNGDVIIRKQIIRLHASDEKLAFDCKQYLNEIVSDKLSEIYQRIFHQNIHKHSYINISNIKVDIGNMRISEFKSRFLEIVEEKIVIELKKQFEENPHNKNFSVGDNFNLELDHSSSSIEYSSEKDQKKLILLYFFQNGTYPWWYEQLPEKSPSQILATFNQEEQKEFFFKLLTKLRSLSITEAERTFSRFADYTTSIDLVVYINLFVDLYADNSGKANITMLLAEKNQLAKLFNVPKKMFLKQLLSFILLHIDETDFIKKFLINLRQSITVSAEEIKKRTQEMKLNIVGSDLEKLIYNDLFKTDEINLAENSNKKSFDSHKTKESLYIENAGLILLHPFLPAYFKDLKLINDGNQFISANAQSRASVLLYYLQCGSEKYNEWEMPLNKILCGLQCVDLIPKGIKLKKKEKEESKLLLETVIKYWEALKGSSTEALQNTFFLRKGKITPKDNSWLMQVERTGVDILLDRLPWSIGTVKLPWLKEIIHTEW